jgi:hypothetical protein
MYVCMYIYIYSLSVLYIVFCFVKLLAMAIVITKANVKGKRLTYACIMYTFDILCDHFYIYGAMECGKMSK